MEREAELWWVCLQGPCFFCTIKTPKIWDIRDFGLARSFPELFGTQGGVSKEFVRMKINLKYSFSQFYSVKNFLDIKDDQRFILEAEELF